MPLILAGFFLFTFSFCLCFDYLSGFISAIAGRLVAGIAYYVTPILRYTRLGKYLRSGPISGAVLAQLALSAEGNAAFYDGATVHPSSGEFSFRSFRRPFEHNQFHRLTYKSFRGRWQW